MARLVGINHVALEVGDIEEAIAFYGKIFDLEFRGRGARMAFLDIGDQFIALSAGRRAGPDEHRHFGVVVDDKDGALAAAREAGAQVSGNDFLDPWGHRVQIVAYADVRRRPGSCAEWVWTGSRRLPQRSRSCAGRASPRADPTYA
jgi:predicted enzyme related to lactoylglutathione lyase